MFTNLIAALSSFGLGGKKKSNGHSKGHSHSKGHKKTQKKHR